MPWAVEGTLSAAYLRTRLFASLTDANNPIAGRLLPELYQAVLVSMGNNILVLRGAERIGTPDARIAVARVVV